MRVFVFPYLVLMWRHNRPLPPVFDHRQPFGFPFTIGWMLYLKHLPFASFFLKVEWNRYNELYGLRLCEGQTSPRAYTVDGFHCLLLSIVKYHVQRCGVAAEALSMLDTLRGYILLYPKRTGVRQRALVDFSFHSISAVSYTHLTLPTILLV